MSSDIAEHIATIRVIDTHSHMQSDLQWEKMARRMCLWTSLACTAGTISWLPARRRQAVARLLDGTDPDIEGRFDAIADAWHAMQFTGYGEVVRIVAEQVYGIEELSGPAAVRAQARLDALRTAAGQPASPPRPSAARSHSDR